MAVDSSKKKKKSAKKKKRVSKKNVKKIDNKVSFQQVASDVIKELDELKEAAILENEEGQRQQDEILEKDVFNEEEIKEEIAAITNDKEAADFQDKLDNLTSNEKNNTEKQADSNNLVNEECSDDDITNKPLEKVVVSDEKSIYEIERNDKKKNWSLFIVLLIFILGMVIYLVIPKIKLNGKNEITISYNDIYNEEGYQGKLLFKDITKDIKIDNNLDNSKIGDYKITYTYRLGLITFKKVRIVHVIDDVLPNIEADKEIINICPNEVVPEIKYMATDEYDGNLTDRIIKEINDDKIILKVKDKSNNEGVLEIPIDRIDKEKPVITLKGYQTLYLNVGERYTEAGYTASDNCDGNISDKVKVSGEVGTSIGRYTLIYEVTDQGGNTATATREIVVRNASLYNSGTIGTGVIYLTFDDGPNEGTTNAILDVLKEEGVKATFFVTCNGPDYLIKRIYDEGHTLALHTATHDYAYVYSSVDNYFNDLNRVSNRVKNITGFESKIIRFPGGSSNTVSRNYKIGIMSELTSMVLDKGYRYFDWNVDAMDASSARSSSDVYNNVTSHLSKSRSNVVLMHDTKWMTRDAIRNIIRYGQANGYSFSKIEMDTYMIRHGVNN